MEVGYKYVISVRIRLSEKQPNGCFGVGRIQTSL